MSRNFFSITAFAALVIAFTIASCKNEGSEGSANATPSANLASTATDINAFANEYIKTLQTDSVKIVDSATCANGEMNIGLYEKGIYNYELEEVTTVKGKINDDADDDFIVSYTAGNCWRGIGAGNYLSNFFIVNAKSGKFEADEAATMKLKQALISAVTKEYKDNAWTKAKKYQMMNQISFVKIADGIASGNMSITQCGATPCLEAEFEYNFKSNTVSLKNIKKLEEQ
jgi:hypothetical protein